MYETLSLCLAEVKSNPATRGLIGTDEYDAYLTNQLQITAGKNAGGETIYRPYYTAAKFLEQFRPQQLFSKADGAEFTGLSKPIASLLGQQASLDVALGLIVPIGFEAVALDGTVPGVSLAGASRRRGTRSHVTQSRP